MDKEVRKIERAEILLEAANNVINSNTPYFELDLNQLKLALNQSKKMRKTTEELPIINKLYELISNYKVN